MFFYQGGAFYEHDSDTDMIIDEQQLSIGSASGVDSAADQDAPNNQTSRKEPLQVCRFCAFVVVVLLCLF